MLIYNDNSFKSLFSDSNFTDDNLANRDEDENEIMDCSSFQDIYPINNPSILSQQAVQNNIISRELLPTRDYSKHILKVFPFQRQIELNEDEEEIDEDIRLFKTNIENSKKDSINTLHEIVEPNSNENVNIGNMSNIDNIKNLLNKNQISNEITNKIDRKYISNKDIYNVSKFRVKQKQERTKNIININNVNNLQKKRGRKTQDDNTKRKHDENSHDNILKKCKRVLFDSVIEHTNLIINAYKSITKEKFELKKLNYSKYINKLKKEDEIKLLNMKLKDFVSLEISAKIWKSDKDYNQKIIQKILEEEKNNKEINSFLNMTFGEWIDVFAFKKKLDYDLNFNILQDTLLKLHNKIFNIKIKKNDNLYFNKHKGALDELYKEKEKYFTRFIYYLFNYQNYFYNKKEKNQKKKENENTEMLRNKNE